MKTCSLPLLAILLFAAASNAQTALLNEFKPVSDFFAAEKGNSQMPFAENGSLTEALDHTFDSITALSPIIGFNASMFLPDGTVWKRARGSAAELPLGAPLTTNHLMGIGSITKSFVAATLLLLYEDGLLDLGDSIGKFVGPYPNIPGNVTIRQLLSHRSGINDYLNENPAMIDALFAHLDSTWVADTILNHYVLAPNFPVGTDWSYSNTNYLLAGRIIESLTGQAWHQVVRQRLLDPLGLTHTFAYPWEKPAPQPFSHMWADLIGNGTVQDWQGFGLSDVSLFSAAGSAGCLIGTPEDLVLFSERLYGGHLLKASTLAEMQVDYLQNGSKSRYGLGTATFELSQNLDNWGHNGSLIYKSFALYFPSLNISLAVQQNDNRYYDPSAPNPIYDHYVVFEALLNAYLNYTPNSATDEPGQVSSDLAVYPNPAGQSFRLHITGKKQPDFPLRVQLVDINGKEILTTTIQYDQEEVYIGHLPSGMYRVRAEGFYGKLVRE